ncbi:unnamed protein product [Citrullus colocynthis]|uniref:Uncharacterized protein n=1 Tax=Citrullus colocynthis TaxID=252529 RepID=A0ABP0Z6E3_9ROSI
MTMILRVSQPITSGHVSRFLAFTASSTKFLMSWPYLKPPSQTKALADKLDQNPTEPTVKVPPREKLLTSALAVRSQVAIRLHSRFSSGSDPLRSKKAEITTSQ